MIITDSWEMKTGVQMISFVKLWPLLFLNFELFYFLFFKYQPTEMSEKIQTVFLVINILLHSILEPR